MRAITSTLLLAVLLISTAAPVNAEANVERLFLFGASADRSAWYGPDASDQELDAATISCSSTALDGERGCPIEPNGSLYAWFLPRLLLQEQVTWNATSPLRFHVEVSAEGASVQGVYLLVQTARGVPESPAAQEVSPGVFEGSMKNGWPLDPRIVSPLGIRVEIEGIASSIAIRTDGGSWVDLPTGVRAVGIPELVAGDTYRPAPATAAIGERTFTFNDGDFQTWTFDGTMVGTRAHEVVLPRSASTVIAWVESFSRPIAYAALTDGEPDSRTLFQYPYLRLVSGGAALDTRERGVAATSVPAGPLSVEVIRSNFHWSTAQVVEGVPYTLHVVASYGDRTLAAMRWPLPQARWTVAKTPFVAECPYGSESVPQPTHAPTFALDLSWEGPTASTQRWTMNYDLPGAGFVPCGEMFTGSTLRLTLPGPRVWEIGPTPAMGGTFVAIQDTRFEMTVRYTYDAL